MARTRRRPGSTPATEPAGGEATAGPGGDPGEGDWSSAQLATSAEGLAESLGTEVENAFDGDRDLSPAADRHKLENLGLSDSAWSGVGGGDCSGAAPNIEAYVASQSSLAEFWARNWRSPATIRSSG